MKRTSKKVRMELRDSTRYEDFKYDYKGVDWIEPYEIGNDLLFTKLDDIFTYDHRFETPVPGSEAEKSEKGVKAKKE